MLKTIDQKDIIGNANLTPSVKRNKIKKYMDDLGYKSSNHLTFIIENNFFRISSDALIMIAKMKLIPDFDAVMVQLERTKWWFFKPADAFQIVSHISDWCEANINSVPGVKEYSDSKSESFKKCWRCKSNWTIFHDSWCRWPIKIKKNILKEFVKSINSYSDLMTKRPKSNPLIMINYILPARENALKEFGNLLQNSRKYMPIYITDREIEEYCRKRFGDIIKNGQNFL